jgi:hypothetical protein
LVDQKKKYRYIREEKILPITQDHESIRVENTSPRVGETDAVQKESTNFGSDIRLTNEHLTFKAPDIDDEVNNNERLNCTTIKSLLPKTFYLIFNLFTVYFLEYTIITSFADIMG